MYGRLQTIHSDDDRSWIIEYYDRIGVQELIDYYDKVFVCLFDMGSETNSILWRL